MRNTFYKIVLEDTVVKNWWIEYLDLLLDDDKFAEEAIWTKGSKQKLTRAIKRRMEGRLIIWTQKDAASKRPAEASGKPAEYIRMTSDGSVCVSMFRHIRNALAHKRAELVIYNHGRYYRLRDYHNGKVTAEMLLSQETLAYFCRQYRSIANQAMKKQNSRKNSRSSGNFCGIVIQATGLVQYWRL